MSDGLGWARRVPGGWLLSVHARPGAKRTEVAGLHGDALKLRVAAPPLEGRANEELAAFVAEALGVPKGMVRVVKGGASRPQDGTGRSATGRSCATAAAF